MEARWGSRRYRERVALCAAYTLHFLSGSVLVLDSPESLKTIGSLNIVIWHMFLMVGSLIAIYGVVRKSSIVEAIGLPLLLSVLAVYITALISRVEGPQMGVAFLLGSNVVFLCERLATIASRLRISNEMSRRGR